VEFKSHVHALACLRELNQNKKCSSSATCLPPSAAKDGTLRSTLIVEFALEYMQKVKILQGRIVRQASHTKESIKRDDAKLEKHPRESAEDSEVDSFSHGASDSDDGAPDSDCEAEDSYTVMSSSNEKSPTPAVSDDARIRGAEKSKDVACVARKNFLLPVLLFQQHPRRPRRREEASSAAFVRRRRPK